MMPIFRVSFSANWRAMMLPSSRPEPDRSQLISKNRGLPPVVGKGLVGLGHAMRVFLLLDGAAAVLRGLEQLAGEAGPHRLLAAGLRNLDDPAHGKGQLAARADFHRDLVGRAADAAGLDLDRRL